jgi:hypothetical protein
MYHITEVIKAIIPIIPLINQFDLSYRRKKARKIQKYGTLNTTSGGNAQGHSDKLKPENLELQQVTEDSNVLNRKLEFCTCFCQCV